MLLIVRIDLADADLEAFEAYETAALRRLAPYGGELKLRLRSLDDRQEIHLVAFPDAEAFAAFREDPVRASLADAWTASGARSSLEEVRPL